jgi:hypothetical protein
MTHAKWLRQEIDLSYLNQPDINALVLMADFRGIDRHFQTWGTLLPPPSCVERLFVTQEGKTITQQIRDLEQVSTACCPCKCTSSLLFNVMLVALPGLVECAALQQRQLPGTLISDTQEPSITFDKFVLPT